MDNRDLFTSYGGRLRLFLYIGFQLLNPSPYRFHLSYFFLFSVGI